MQGIFFMHTPKCGGHSIRKALDSCKINYIRTNDIDVDLENDAYKEVMFNSRKEWLVFGHSSAIPIGKTKASRLRYKDLLNVLHNKSLRLMPARHPVNLLRSWMYYQKMLVNQHIISQKVCRKNLFEDIQNSKLEEYINTMACIFNTKDEFIDNEGFILNIEKEEEYLFRYLKVILRYKFLVPAWSHTLQLYYPIHKKLFKLLKAKVKVHIDLSKDIEKGNLILYNSEKYSEETKIILNEYICEDFVQNLVSIRENISHHVEEESNHEYLKFEQYYKSLFSCEFDIFNQAI